LQLLDLAPDLLRARPELLPAQPGAPQLQRLHHQLVSAHRGLHDQDDRLQRVNVVRQRISGQRHAQNLARNLARKKSYLIESNKESEADQATRPGGALQAGRRQSNPSHRIDNWADVSRAVPSADEGQGKRPFSRSL
jgi:hypothetical protein